MTTTAVKNIDVMARPAGNECFARKISRTGKF